ncbi:hypothetical protein [Nocardiopsis ansamitocini]|uniref:hypothetical protein n=1 Tax=Nocardiopsis ansamitocini TaxID=1670832 RepID=UPI0025556BD2|nr:hypothetical protein [Nocardiopsis ansamitocini]
MGQNTYRTDHGGLPVKDAYGIGTSPPGCPGTTVAALERGTVPGRGWSWSFFSSSR